MGKIGPEGEQVLRSCYVRCLYKAPGVSLLGSTTHQIHAGVFPPHVETSVPFLRVPSSGHPATILQHLSVLQDSPAI